jgi:hypothetical protein
LEGNVWGLETIGVREGERGVNMRKVPIHVYENKIMKP